jgi:hypothetical protein
MLMCREHIMDTRKWAACSGLIVGIAAFSPAANVESRECPEYKSRKSTEFWCSQPGRIEVSGSHAYLAPPPEPPFCKAAPPAQQIVIADISDQAAPRVVGRFLEGVSVIDFSVVGDRVFSLGYYCGIGLSDTPYLRISDVSDPSHPVQLYFAAFQPRSHADPTAIDVVGSTAFVATDEGLHIIDVSDPTSPTGIGFHSVPWHVSDLVVDGHLAYAVAPESGLWVIDISHPTDPLDVGRLATAWQAYDLEVSNGAAYVADGAGGLRVIDVTDPANPAEVGILRSDVDVMNVAVDGSRAAVGLNHSAFLIVDVSDPAHPTRHNALEIEGPARDVALSGNTAYVVTEPLESAGAGGFRTFDLSDAGLKTARATFDFQSTAMAIAVSNAVTFVANGDSGLYALDESRPEEAVEGFLDTPGFASDVVLYEQYALVADDHRGLRVVDVSDVGNMREVGSVDTPGQARRVAVIGDTVYLADGDGGLRIIDVSSPEAPIELGASATLQPASDVAVAGDYAYVAAGNLMVVDVSTPADPVPLDLDEPTHARALTVEGRLLYSVGAYLEVLDLSDPSAPQQLEVPERWMHVSAVATDIEIVDHHAYVAFRRESPGRSGGVSVYDVLNPYYPSWLGRWEFDGDGWGTETSNGRTFLAGGASGLIVLDNRCLTTYWLGAVIHESGLHGSEWRSDVVISHRADRRVAFDLVLHTIDGEIRAGASIDVGEQGVFEDIVGLLGYEGAAALEIQTNHPITVTSRTYSEAHPGTYGAFLQGHRGSECFGTGTLYGIRQVEGRFRTNISVTNTTSESREVQITLYRTDGLRLARYSLDVGPRMLVQDLQPFKNRAAQPDLGWGYASVNGGRGILAFASVIDSRTNDALIVPLRD